MHPIVHEIKEALQGVYSDSEARALAKLLLVEVLGFSTLEFYGGKDKVISEKEHGVLTDIIRRLQQNEPIQYIIGMETFCSLPFFVTKDVLIPRPETQELVEWVLADNQCRKSCHILDIGTGSGCIAISLAKRMKDSQVEAWDLSAEALKVASKNAFFNEVEVSFKQQDVLTFVPTEACWDVMVSNPPYITEDEKAEMEPNVLHWEPEMALFVQNDDPLLFYRRIADLGLVMLKPHGSLYFEINRAYGKDMVMMLEGMGYTQIELRQDMFGNDRMIKAKK